MSTSFSSNDQSSQNSRMSDTGEKHTVVWYQSTITAALLVSVTAFTCPGIFGALNGMGAGGGASPDVSNAANAIVFGTLAIGCPFVGAIVNRITPKWGLVVCQPDLPTAR